MNINWWEYHILNRHDNLIYIKYTVISTFDFTVKNCIKHFEISKFDVKISDSMVYVTPLSSLWLLNKELSSLAVYSSWVKDMSLSSLVKVFLIPAKISEFKFNNLNTGTIVVEVNDYSFVPKFSE